MTDTFVYVTYIKTTPEKLWEALTSSDFTEKYFFGSKIQSGWQEGSNVTYSRNGQVTDHTKVRAASITFFYLEHGRR